MPAELQTILVVDDHTTNRKLFRAILEAEGYAVSEAADGMEALAELERVAVDAIVSDILMPNLDGFGLCHAVRTHEQLHDRSKHLPIIISTNTFTSLADEKLALKVGADKYLKKPVSTRLLLEALKEYLTSPNYRRPSQVRIAVKETGMKEYSEALVRKLEEKNVELERAQFELKKANEQLEARVEERTSALEAVNIELEAFNQSVAHDLRNPLSVIMAQAGILQCNHDEETAQNRVRNISDSAVRMNELIEDLLKLSRIKNGELEPGFCDLSILVQSIADELRQSNPQRKIKIVIAPAVTADADSRLLRIALENLLANAWKFTAKSQEAEIEFGRRSEGDEAVYFVRDNGVGFEMEHAGRLFRPFERLHSKADFPGTGIGLTIVQRVLMKHGGRIWAKGEPGKGAAFYFTLSPSKTARESATGSRFPVHDRDR